MYLVCYNDNQMGWYNDNQYKAIGCSCTYTQSAKVSTCSTLWHFRDWSLLQGVGDYKNKIVSFKWVVIMIISTKH